MRRQKKFIVNGFGIGFAVTTVADILLQWIETVNLNQRFTWEVYNGQRTMQNAAIGGFIGAGAGYIIYKRRIIEEHYIPFNSDEYLKKVITEEHLKADPALFKKVVSTHKKVKLWMGKEFRKKLAAPPEDTGSFIKRTAITSNYDLDIVLPFKRNSYRSLEMMYDDVHDVIKKSFGSKAIIQKQTKAIGVTLKSNGNEIHFDIVPGREIDDYTIDKKLNLFVRPNWIWQRGSSFKTNIRAQRNMTVNRPEARKVIKLIKAYRDRNQLSLPTYVVEQSVVEALSEKMGGVHISTTENLLNCMNFICVKLSQRNFYDISNSNNNLNNKLNENERSTVLARVQNDMENIEKNSRYIKEIFEC